MNFVENDNSSWIDDVIKKHKRKLNDLKQGVEEDREKYPEFKGKLKHPNLTDHSSDLKKKISNLNYDYSSYMTLPMTTKHFDSPPTLSTKSEINDLKGKLEEKCLRLREVKKQFENVCEENVHLKSKLKELEKFKQVVGEKLDYFEMENTSNDMKYVNRDREMMITIKDLEEENLKIKRYYDKIISDQMEEFDRLKDKNFGLERSVENLNFFFKKLQNYLQIEGETARFENEKLSSSSNFLDYKYTEDKLLELEKFITKIINERDAVNQKYSKILKIQSKLAESESFDNSLFHLETVKKLNRKIYDLSEENKLLKENLCKINEKVYEKQQIVDENNNLKFSDSFKTLQKRVEELENEIKLNKESFIEKTNGEKEIKEKKNPLVRKEIKTDIRNNPKSSTSKNIKKIKK